MDPLTAALNLANGVLAFGIKVWDVTPQAQQITAAGDWAKFTHNIGSFIVSVQDKINSVVMPPTAGVK